MLCLPLPENHNRLFPRPRLFPLSRAPDLQLRRLVRCHLLYCSQAKNRFTPLPCPPASPPCSLFPPCLRMYGGSHHTHHRWWVSSSGVYFSSGSYPDLSNSGSYPDPSNSRLRNPQDLGSLFTIPPTWKLFHP